MIELKNVSFQYGAGERSAGLFDLSLLIPNGQVVLLCGESGCGKTTLTRLLNGLIPHYYEGQLTGQVLVNGLDVSQAPLYQTASSVGSVFQNPRSQFFNVDTTSELVFGCENLGLDETEIRRRLRETVRDFSLEALMNRSIFALSGGEKQKIACASVSALDPEVFVLDEPSSNLDAAATAELAEMLRLWKSQGKTIVISEHRLHYLRGLVDKIFYLKDGRIVEEFTMKEFARLSVQQMEVLGLRPLCLEQLSGACGFLPASEESGKIGFSKLCFAYPRSKETLQIEDLSLPRGSIAAVIGHNGAGKSTLARCACGLEKKCRARLRISDRTVTAKHCLKHCYMVMQDVNHQLFTESVLDEVLLSMEREDVKEAERILDSLHLLELKDLHPMSLSGGQKQRVAIASAVASGRELILFDEPTSGLDLRHMREVARNLRDLSRQGKTLLVITHDPELILSCCTDVLHLEQGRIAAQYPLDEAGADRMLSFFLKSAASERQVV